MQKFSSQLLSRKEKKGEEAESWAISFFSPIAQKWGWYCFQDTDRFEVTTTVVTNFTCCANKSTRFFFASRVDLNASNLREVKVILITVMLAHLQLKQINLSSKLSHNYCWAVEIWPKKNWVEMLLLLLSEETEAEILCVPASFSTFSSALLRQHCPDWRMGVISWSSHIKMIPKWPLRNAWKRGEEPFLE